MNAERTSLEAATIRQQCKVLHLPSIAAQCTQLAEQAVRERRTHLGYLEALLQAELEDREQRLIERRIHEARLPRMKTIALVPKKVRSRYTRRTVPISRSTKAWERGVQEWLWVASSGSRSPG